MMDDLENFRQDYFDKLTAYRAYYLHEGQRREDGFEVLLKMPDGVEWIMDNNRLVMQGSQEGLKEMTMVIQAFSHDYDTVGLLHQHFLLLKHNEPATFEDLVVIAMPDDAWAFWGGKMGDIAYELEFEQLFFNWMGFFDPLPVDIGIRVTDVDDDGE